MCGPGVVGKDASGPVRALFSPARAVGIAAFNTPIPNSAVIIRIVSFIATLLSNPHFSMSIVTSIVVFKELFGD
jgi:hypothetical protein